MSGNDRKISFKNKKETDAMNIVLNEKDGIAVLKTANLGDFIDKQLDTVLELIPADKVADDFDLTMKLKTIVLQVFDFLNDPIEKQVVMKAFPSPKKELFKAFCGKIYDFRRHLHYDNSASKWGDEFIQEFLVAALKRAWITKIDPDWRESIPKDIRRVTSDVGEKPNK